MVGDTAGALVGEIVSFVGVLVGAFVGVLVGVLACVLACVLAWFCLEHKTNYHNWEHNSPPESRTIRLELWRSQWPRALRRHLVFSHCPL